MTDIAMIVVGPADKRQEAILSDAVEMDGLAPELAQRLGVPLARGDGRPLTYQVYSDSCERELGGAETLASAEVEERSILRLVAFEAPIGEASPRKPSFVVILSTPGARTWEPSLAEQLAREGVDFWFDSAIPLGQNIWDSLQAALSRANVLICLIADGLTETHAWLDTAAEFAERREVPVVPLLFDGATAPASVSQYMSFAIDDTRTYRIDNSLHEFASRVVNDVLGGGESEPERASVDDELPELSNELVTAFSLGSPVLVAGPELPLLRGLPGRTALLEKLLLSVDTDARSVARRRLISDLRQGRRDDAVRFLRSAEVDLEMEIQHTYDYTSLSETYAALAKLPFVSVICANWDPQLLRAFGFREPVVLDGDAEGVLDAVKHEVFSFVWLAGLPRSGAISASDFELRSHLFASVFLSRMLADFIQANTLFFVGCTVADVEGYFNLFPQLANVGSTGPHYALVPKGELWELDVRRMSESYGTKLIGYDTLHQGAVNELAHELGRSVATESDRSIADRGPESLSRGVNRIKLENIGAFEELDLELSAAWNVVLGTNGCGKTTILRAVALALCGDHPKASEVGEQLLRIGSDGGWVEVVVGGSRFRTELVRAGGTVMVRSNSISPVERGNIVLLGFPALRGLSVASPAGISSQHGSEPRVEDVLPLLFDRGDNRLDDIKQWIVNVYVRSRQEDGSRWQSMLIKFFDVLGDLTPGLDLAFGSVDLNSWDVRVHTDDGEVSIDQLSQGISSIIAWVGSLIQRMYEVYESNPDPTLEYAFVLLDEIDAHLHPSWQRLLPNLVHDHFPNVQFLATTHSPLVVSGLAPAQIFSASRELRSEGGGSSVSVAALTDVSTDPRGLRADQILASELFGLMTSRSPDHVQEMEEYAELASADSLSSPELARMNVLRERLSRIYRSTPEVAGTTDGRRSIDELIDNATDASELELLRSTLEDLLDDGEKQ